MNSLLIIMNEWMNEWMMGSEWSWPAFIERQFVDGSFHFQVGLVHHFAETNQTRVHQNRTPPRTLILHQIITSFKYFFYFDSIQPG